MSHGDDVASIRARYLVIVAARPAYNGLASTDELNLREEVRVLLTRQIHRSLIKSGLSLRGADRLVNAGVELILDNFEKGNR